ncbi:TPA: ABZJ_00895 family protein [Vibrio parahaemolyticus]|nr:ABZJ_00895 family protein [Vibrio parahaemolyticus]
MKVESKNNYSIKNNAPSVLFVTSLLCLASVCLAILLFIIEYISGMEMNGVGFLGTLIPAMSVGYYFGYKTGNIMPSTTRWYSVLLWNLSSLVVFSLILMFLDISIFKLIAELGWFSIIIVVLTLITVCLGYFIFKSGEKMAIKVLLEAQKSV